MQWDQQLGPRCLAVVLFPDGVCLKATMSYQRVTEAESHGRRTDVLGATATHPGHRRPSAFWNPAKTPSRPACGSQRARRGLRSSAPLGTYPAGLGEWLVRQTSPTKTPSSPPSSPPIPAITHPPVTSDGWHAGLPWTHGQRLCHSSPTGWPRSPRSPSARFSVAHGKDWVSQAWGFWEGD